ncbi:hypothetical protein H6P81_017359 [Aristolochia fimbriata]|uniref:DUF674 domain-containing protein n=1 Tax=Aristolochia fimbriata TaxID=158543 RepID=A0AAV7DZX4_ARIFI|nr:hypothetical protein H6P81_017359 [Aristolochia fimbriata]
MAAEKKIPLKLMVDKEKKRVVWAETDSDFVDVVFSFLTMPIGTIVRLATKESKIGSMDGLYRSIEKMDEKYFQTPACKAMLLRPRNASQKKCHKLAVKIDDTTVSYLYWCSNCSVLQYYLDTCKKCGRVMPPQGEPEFSKVNGVFVKGRMEFVVKDDLQVIPVSATSSLFILQTLEIKDEMALEEMDIEFGREEAMNLLKCFLLSTTALTDGFLPKPENMVLGQVIKPSKTEKMTEKEDAKETLVDSKVMMQGKLIIRKSSDEVVYLEATEDMTNFIVSFLTFPVGLIAKLVGGYSLPGSAGNLYQSIEELKAEDHLNSKESKTELLNPKLACLMGSDDQLFGIEEAVLPYTNQCLNTKFAHSETKKGGSFMKGSSKFMLTDDLTVEMFSPSAAFSLLKKLNVPLHDLKVQDITIGAEEAVKLLRAAMTSTTVLTDVFCPKKEEHELHSPESSTASVIEEQFVCL